MIKGCRKNVVWVRNTGSDMFDEAYFILSDKSSEKKMSDGDMITAASRIVDFSPVSSYFEATHNSEKKKRHPEIYKAVWFMLGAAVMAALNTVLFFII